jgi:hypothetical protein
MGMRTRTIWLVAVAMVALVSATAAPGAWAKKLEEAEIYIEINDTDGDAGIHVFLDGEGWDVMQMTGPNGVEFGIAADNSVGLQGITELFFESAEPSFDEQPLEELLELFPAGIYRFEGATTEGKPLKGKARLTHHLPDAPVQVSPLDGEEVDPESAVFTWEEVDDPPGSEIVGYELVVECEEPDLMEFVARVGPEVTSITVSPEFLNQEDMEECKWEILALEDSGNQTISETEFEID